MHNRLGLVRKRPSASVWSSLNFGLRPRGPFYPGSVDCPEAGETISFAACLSCPKYAEWHAQDDGLKRCWFEFKDLASRGYYDGTWDEHPENFDAKTFAEIQEQKRLNEEVRGQMEAEKPELERMARELEGKFPPSFFSEYYGLDDEEDDDEEKDDRADEDEDDYS